MVNEIGSEFHKVLLENGSGIKLPRRGSFVFSGRTAIESVIKNISNIHSVLIPSYCCDSMIVPFRNLNIQVKFYDVYWDNGLRIDINENADVLLWCNYFGFQNDIPEFDGVIIEDITHSFFSDKSYHSCSDYLVASLRKWEPILSGGYCSIDMEGRIPPQEYLRLKSSAMDLKARYLIDYDENKKNKYLQMFDVSNQWISSHYSDFAIDDWSLDYLKKIDLEEHIRIRRNNAHILYEGLKNKVKFLVPENESSCPLFVPILLNDRDSIRSYLIDKKIYCPIHWPKPNGCASNIYDMELSLICDQRYSDKDMNRIVSVLNEIL